ncbi:hypothetical protein J4E83_004869 [Alternaria metachromatica]|uniref:uncharacterized protein n=1 Tax=Alternaria metachromatica TaxID=283354 RepID=UPI0020C2644C|nr:uncharacterized protein J4E83_004869 [Alternaria metachromatica]KAI4622129.1 hypothetical protein J4E83_004869 [Alternaria metachromatica]
MSPSKLGVFAHLALAASAVLIPSTMTNVEDLGDDHAFESLAINPSQRSVALECPGCAVATLDGKELKWKSDVGSAFRLDFDVGPHGDALNLNNAQLYPPSFGFPPQPYTLTQVDPSTKEGLRLQITGYEFRYDGAETISEEGTELLPMTFQITSVEGTAVNPPALQINVLKNSEGRLMIASFNEAERSPATPSDKECNEWPLYCKWKNIMAGRIEQIKGMRKPRPGCHKRPHAGARPNNPMEHEGMAGKPPHRFRPGKAHPHHHPHHMGQHRHHGFAKMARRAFFTIFVPILIGIFAGTLTYLVGMALGCLIAITVAKVRGQRYQPIALDEEDVEEAEERGEKEEYAELPAYDAPPVYEEAADEEAAVKKTDETK